MWCALLLSVLTFASFASAIQFTLPDVCLCNDAKGPQPLLLECSLRVDGQTSMSPCWSQGVFNTTKLLKLAPSIALVSCICLGPFPEMHSLYGFVDTLVSSATWAVLSPKAAPVDRYVELEYLYGEHAELLVQYKSSEGLYGTTLRRHGQGNGNQTFWYGPSPLLELFMKN